MRDSKFWRIIAVAICGGLFYVGYGLHNSSSHSPSPPPEISEKLITLQRELEEFASSQTPRIEVMDSDWGSSAKSDVRAVCQSACSEIHHYLRSNRFAPIQVSRHEKDPLVQYRSSADSPYSVLLNSKDRHWAQLAFQMSHEFGHICCNYRNVANEQMWFEESVCECASLFTLKSMSKSWRVQPPFPSLAVYSSALGDYEKDRVQHVALSIDSLPKWYRANVDGLRRDPNDRDRNTAIAIRLLPIFDRNPSNWEAIRYLNLGEPTENASFDRYLAAWRSRVPVPLTPVVDEVAALFGITLPK
jgi:hypothetical protein